MTLFVLFFAVFCWCVWADSVTDTAAPGDANPPLAPAAPSKNFRTGSEVCIIDAQVIAHERPCGVMMLFKLAAVEDRVKVVDGVGEVVDCGGKNLRFVRIQETVTNKQGWALESELTSRCTASGPGNAVVPGGGTTQRLSCARDLPCPDESFACKNGVCLDREAGDDESENGGLDTNTIIYIAVGAGGGGLCCLILCILLLACFVLGNRKKADQRALNRQVPPDVAQQFMMQPPMASSFRNGGFDPHMQNQQAVPMSNLGFATFQSARIGSDYPSSGMQMQQQFGGQPAY
jgi:hypothetical protein